MVIGYLKTQYRNNSFVRQFISQLYYLLKRNSKIIKGKKNTIEHHEALLANVQFEIYGDSNEVVLGQNSKISNCKIYIKGNNHKLEIGENCVIKSGELWFEDEHCEIRVGSKTTIEGAHIAVTEPYSKITLGEDCMLSAGIDIRSGDSHSIVDLHSKKRLNHAKNVEIGNHVWVGNKATILKGTVISDDSIVSTGAIVTKKFADKNVILSGVPSEIIKRDVTWSRERIYQAN